MLVNRLPLIIVFGMKLAIWPGNCLRSFVSFETQIPYLVLVRLLLVAEPVIAKHQVVLRLQVFGINFKHGIQGLHGIAVFSLQEQDAPIIIQSNSVSRILRQNLLQFRGSSVIISITPQNASIEIMCARKVRTQ